MNAFAVGDYIERQGQAGRDQRIRRNVNAFASQAYAADPMQREQIVQRAIAQDADSGFALDKTLQADEERRTRTLVNMSKMLTGTPEQYREPLYQRMRPSLQRLGLTTVPEIYTPEVGQVAEQLVAAYGGTAANGVQSTYVNRAGQRVAIMRDGSQQILGDADARTQLRDQPGLAPSIVDLRTGTARPLSEGGAPQPAPAATGEVPFAIDPSLPPEVQAQIRQAEVAGRPVPDQITVASSGLTAPRPAVSPAEAERLRLAQEANARAAAAEQRAREAADRARLGTAPAGQRFRADGTLEDIPGARSTVTASEDERKAAGWLNQASKALADMDAAAREDADAAVPGLVEAYSPVDELANRSRSPARQRYVQASSAFAEAVLRAATGAGVNESEARQKVAELTPQRGDSEAVIKQKRASAAMYIESLRARAGRALPQGERPSGDNTPSAAPVRRARNPRTGEVLELRNGQWVPAR